MTYRMPFYYGDKSVSYYEESIILLSYIPSQGLPPLFEGSIAQHAEKRGVHWDLHVRTETCLPDL